MDLGSSFHMFIEGHGQIISENLDKHVTASFSLFSDYFFPALGVLESRAMFGKYLKLPASLNF